MSKRYVEAAKVVDKEKLYAVEEAIRLAKQTASVKFDAAIDVHIKLNIDPKQSDQRVRTQVMLPHGTGKKIKVAAFVSGAKEKAAKDGRGRRRRRGAGQTNQGNRKDRF